MFVCRLKKNVCTIHKRTRALVCELSICRIIINNIFVSGSLAPAQKRLQEAKFELLTSEASYLNSLNVLENHFIAHPAFRDPHILPRAEWETLFSTILPGWYQLFKFTFLFYSKIENKN